MSEQPTLEAIRANTAAMNTQVMEDYADTFTEDAVWEDDALPAPAVGRAAVVQTMVGFYAAFPDLHFDVEREFASGDQAAVCWRVTGTHRGEFGGLPPTGRRLEYHACGIMQIRDGKIAYVRTYLDTGTILRQVGVLPGGDEAREP
ncbi:MAG: ester cyclase [Nitriliruptorales bacterium]